MNIAVIKTGGKQYKVAPEQTLTIEKIKGEKGEKIAFDKVMLISDEKATKLQVGQPFLEGTKIEAEIVEQTRTKKVTAVKYKRKTRYTRKIGHRQEVTTVKIAKF
jgi:large subunit ribosomal protein L21